MCDYIKQLMVLPFLPARHIQQIFDYLKTKANTEQLQRLVDYIDRQWFHHPVFDVPSWCVFQQTVRTNNDVETSKEKKRINKIHASYTLEGTDLENVESIKYLGVTITSDLKWNTHVSNVCTKANRTLGFLRRNLHSCPQGVKEAAYKGLMRPVLDYGRSIWDHPRLPPPPTPSAHPHPV